MLWKRLIYHGVDLGDYYLVSDTGEIKGVKTGKIRRKNINHEGYYFVGISLGSRDNKQCIKIHRAVAETFLENSNNYPVINHKDGNKLNNHIDNLEFCTYSQNTIHAYENDLIEINSKKVICLNTLDIFINVKEAAMWCGCKPKNMYDCLVHYRNRQFAGKHPETQECLQWMYYDEYLNMSA